MNAPIGHSHRSVEHESVNPAPTNSETVAAESMPPESSDAAQSNQSEHGWPARQLLACLAGRLLLHYPEQEFLRLLLGQALEPLPQEPRQLADRLAQTGERIYQRMEEPALAQDPLVQLMRRFGLSPFELDLLLLALAPELDERFGNLFAGINNGVRRLALHQALPVLVADSTERQLIRDSLNASGLWRCGLLVDPPTMALFERRLQAGPALSDHVGGRPALASRGALLHAPLGDPTTAVVTGMMHAIGAEAGQLAAWAAGRGPALIHLLDQTGSGTRSHIDALALALQRPWLELSLPASGGREENDEALRQLLAAARIGALLPVLRLDAECSELELTQSALLPLAGPLLIVGSGRVALRTPDSLPLQRWLASNPRPLELVAIWNHFLNRHGAAADVELLANQTHLSVELIARTAEHAAGRATLEGRPGAEHDDVLRSLREILPDPVSRLASSSRPQIGWSSLILDTKSKASLKQLVERVRYRVEVQERWGLGGARFGNRGQGLVGLLHGESGTGKTFAAQVLASRLGLPMLSVDLSRVVSKYIGETEKHLNELFDLGEGFKALLFFDEADALFGKRTGVKDAHDRYANIEVNFLLQRLESFEGVVLLSSNFQQSMDDAFTRRIGFSVFFPRPTPGQRLALWRQNLPAERLHGDVRLEQIAERYELVGGEIRNCALSAAYAAAADQGVVSQTMLEAAIAAEFRKMGRPQPRGISGPR